MLRALDPADAEDFADLEALHDEMFDTMLRIVHRHRDRHHPAISAAPLASIDGARQTYLEVMADVIALATG